MFIDRVEISVKAGKGGNGAVAFRREKYVPNGGPDGGDGGKGGSVILKVDSGMRTLMDFRYKRKFDAQSGEDGGQKNCFGKDGKDLVVRVPAGTIVKDLTSGAVIADMVEGDEELVIAKGGNGGRGNTRFKTPTRQAPAFAEAGYKGEEKKLLLELKSLADVGLCGYPNVGKSTILSMVTKAKPKIADYHFTTLSPNLGVAEFIRHKSFTIADIPGLIDGAADGLGLGHEFLRHIERTRLLLHVVDISGSEGRDPLEDFKNINEELKKYNEELSKRKMIVVANKIDLLGEDEKDNSLKEYAQSLGLEYFEISAYNNQGLEELMKYVTTLLDTIPLPEPVKITAEPDTTSMDQYEINIEMPAEETYRLYGEGLLRLKYATDFNTYQGVRFFENYLKRRGIMDKLKELGLKNGDTLIIDDYEMTYYE